MINSLSLFCAPPFFRFSLSFNRLHRQPTTSNFFSFCFVVVVVVVDRMKIWKYIALPSILDSIHFDFYFFDFDLVCLYDVISYKKYCYLFELTRYLYFFCEISSSYFFFWLLTYLFTFSVLFLFFSFLFFCSPFLSILFLYSKFASLWLLFVVCCVCSSIYCKLATKFSFIDLVFSEHREANWHAIHTTFSRPDISRPSSVGRAQGS